ncbi:MAG: AMP-binding protein [Bacteroidia bacterium]
MFLFALRMQLINLCNNSIENEKLKAFIKKLEASDKVFDFQSSGSTGVPKQFQFSFKQLKISARQTIDFFKLNSYDTLLCPFSMDFVAAKMMVARAFFLNAKLVFTGPISNPFAIEKIPNVTFAAFVPKQLQNILQNSKSIEKLHQVNNILIGGASISNQLQIEIKQVVKTKIFLTYGMTETLTHVAVKDLHNPNSSYIGLKGVKFKVDNRGCLQIKSPVNSQWLTTNDSVKLTATGFDWIGRYDLVINSAGYKIQIESLEKRIVDKVSVNQLFICGIFSEAYGEECIVVSNQNKPSGFEKLFDSDVFHRYEKPKKWVRLDEIPFGTSGKIQRVKLTELANQAIINGEYQNLI